MEMIGVAIAFAAGLILGVAVGYGLCGMMLLAARYAEEEAKRYDGENP